MEIKELVKYVDFKLSTKMDDSYFDYNDAYDIVIRTYGENFTFMIGHQPRTLTEEEIAANKITKPNVITSIDVDDPYWTDDVGDPLGVDYNKVESIGGDLYKTKVTIGDKEFEIIIENDCGFAVAYGPAEIYNYIQENK